MATKKELGKDGLKLIAAFTKKMTVMVAELQKEKPEKEFTLTVYEPNMYWGVNWKSTKRWKTERFLKEFFQVRIYVDYEKYSILGEHMAEDVFEHLCDNHSLAKKKTIKELLEMTDAIVQKTKEAILAAVDLEFDPSF